MGGQHSPVLFHLTPPPPLFFISPLIRLPLHTSLHLVDPVIAGELGTLDEGENDRFFLGEIMATKRQWKGVNMVGQ
jgi:hypothetical protein